MFLNNANNTQPPLAADEFTFDTNWFDRCTDFHDQSLWKLYKKFMEILFRKKKYQPLPRYHRPVNEDQTTPHRLVFWTLIFNLETQGDSAFGQIVWSHFHFDPIAHWQTNFMEPHLTG